ncbi:hypothetical protein HDV06_002556 [Boothiomyces sp. JEL0866]|nr:hypothetical protein HDV06_002556 [Boothiomyces sp. JEL0866]
MSIWSNFVEEVKSGRCAIYGHCEGVFIILLEVPFIAKCLRNTDRIIAISNDNRIKCGIYTIFATLIWLSLIQSAETIIIAAISQTLAAIFYGIAVFKGESGAGSSAINSESVAAAALNRV